MSWLWKIRAAEQRDASVLARLAEETFRDAFGSTNDPGQMDQYCSTAFSEAAMRQAMDQPGALFFLAEADGEAVGYAQAQFDSSPSCVQGPEPVQLKRIYLVRALHGSGLASDLLLTVRDALSERGARTLWLTVWDRNPRAIRFYERSGFTVVGDAEFVLGTERQRDLVMAAPLAQVRP